MATICDRVGFDDTLQGFEFYMENSTPEKPIYYSVWNGQKLKFISKVSDPEEARQEFEGILKVWQRNGTGGMLEARFHNRQPNNQLTNKSEYEGSMTFKLLDRSEMQPLHPGAAAQQPANAFEQFFQQYQMFLKFQQTMQPPAVAVGSDEEKTVWDRIEGILSTPIVEDVIAGAAEKFGLNMSHYKRNETEYQMAGEINAGVVPTMDDLTQTEEQRLRNALERLMVNEPDFVGLMERLADLKEKSPGKYNMAKAFL